MIENALHRQENREIKNQYMITTSLGCNVKVEKGKMHDILSNTFYSSLLEEQLVVMKKL